MSFQQKKERRHGESYLQEKPAKRKRDDMKKKMLLSEDRPAITISLTMPADVINDLERVSQAKGMTDYQPLIKFYVGHGLRKDLAELGKKNSVQEAQRVLGKYNIDPGIIDEVIAAMS